MPENIYFDEKGKGKPVVLLHGFCETHEIWKDVVDALAEKYKVLTPDLPGFGNSPLPTDDITIERIAQKLSKWIKSITSEKVALFGHSLGGYITLAFAEKHPEQLSSFGLIHSSAYADTPEKKENRLKAAEFVRKNGAEPFIRTLIPSLFYNNGQKNRQQGIEETTEISLTSRAETIIAYSLAMKNRPDRSVLLEQKKLPVLFIAGKHDGVIPLTVSKDQIQRITNGEGNILHDSGHMGMIEEPEATVECIINFLDSYENT